MNGGVNGVADGVDPHGKRGRAGHPVQTPNIVIGGFSDRPGLAQVEIVVLHLVEKNVERAGEHPIDSRVEKGRWGI